MAPKKNILISYCTPVMNRSEDLLMTLDFNLKSNAQFADKVEFVVVIFDETPDFFEQLTQTYPKEIESGYLVVVRSDAIKTWHFGRAKNVFKPHMRGALYSSLDGDNYVTKDETEQILSLCEVYGPQFILHHFSGTWGDGTSGRITVGADIYRQVGYDPQFAPLVFDDLDLIITTLNQYPGIPFVSYIEQGFFSIQKEAAQFIAEEKIGITNVVVSRPKHIVPLNPKPSDYGSTDPVVKWNNEFNRNLCFRKNTDSLQKKEWYSAQATEAGRHLIEELSRQQLGEVFFDLVRWPEVHIDCSKKIPVVMCMHNEHRFVKEWVEHYRSIGCGPLFIVDDRSEPPLRTFLEESDDVIVLEPALGNYTTAHTLWMLAILKAYLTEGDWALWADVDEFVDIPASFGGTAPKAVQRAEAEGRTYIPGMLIDMLPEDPARAPNALAAGRSFSEVLSAHLWDEEPDDTLYVDAYRTEGSINWGWGPYWRTSLRADVRFKLFRTIDALRTIPLFRYEPLLLLNRGHHDLKIFGALPGEPGRGVKAEALWSYGELLPTRHYKLVNLFEDAGRNMFEQRSQVQNVYHPRTTENMHTYVTMSPEKLAATLRTLPVVLYDIERASKVAPPSSQ